MKASKSLTSAIVATALVGAIGLAYAQTDPNATNPANAPLVKPDSTNPTAPNQPMLQNQPMTDTTTAPNADAGFQTERPAQADRN